ncbi:MAG: hypothetical protein R2684_09605 [Pyrinomonadaceae bacterium]
MRTRCFIVLMFAFACLSGGALAQSPSKIVSAATKKLGKKKAINAVRSWTKEGLIVRDSDGASGNIKVQATLPGLYNRAFDIRGFESEVGFNGRSGWSRDSRSGLETMTGVRSDDFKTEADYRAFGFSRSKEFKGKFFSTPSITVDGRTLNGVSLVSPKAVPVLLYFDPATHLLVREVVREGDLTTTYDYSDYRPVNGVLEPFIEKFETDGVKYTVRYDKVIHNSMIEQSEFDFPVASNEELPDIPKLLEQLQDNQDNVERILEDYSFKQQTIRREIDDKGKLVETDSETVQLSFYKGYRISRLIAKNGKPLTKQQQEDADKDAQKRVEEIEKKLAKEQSRTVDQTGNGSPDADGRRISIAEVLRASKLLNPRRERLKGRDVVVFDFEPNPDYDFSNAKSFLKFFGKTVGVIWIDEQDKQVARLEAELADSYKIGGGVLAKLRKGASFILEQDRVNDEIWLPTSADVNLSVRVLLFGGVKVNQLQRSFDYEKFRTDVKEAKVDEIQNQ